MTRRIRTCLRVPEEEELAGLAVAEHGTPGYGEALITSRTGAAPVTPGVPVQQVPTTA